MPDINLRTIIRDNLEGPESYILFRTIEDWCHDNIDKRNWKFDYAAKMCVCGVDIPGRIIFKCSVDATIFLLRFSAPLPVDLQAAMQ